MAKGRITQPQLYDNGLFNDFLTGALNTIETIDKMDDSFKKLLVTQREFLSGWKAFDSKSIRELNAAMADSAKIQKQIEQLERERARTQAALMKVAQENEKLVKLTIQSQKEKSKVDDDAAKKTKKKADEERKANSVYEQTKKQLNDVAKALKELEVRGRGGGIVAKGLREEFLKLDEKVRRAEYSVGQFQRNVGNYPQIMGNAEKAVRGLGGALLNIAGIAGGVSLFRSAVLNIGQFEQSLADLRSILGLSADDPSYKKLEDNALKLGTTTMHSAVDVVEAYKLIGSAKPELLENVDALNQVTEAAITLADASGLELPAAATALTDSLNQFGESAAEAQRYINALAAGAKYGSAEIPEVTEALLKFGVAAKSSNISIEESVGLIETFAEKGLKGAEAGTALRNILLKLSAARALPPEALHQLEAAGVDIKKLSDNSLSLSQRLEELSKIQGNSVALVKTFGLENEVAAQALIENRKRVDELTKSVTDTNTAQEQAAERTNTVEGELKKLANTWQALIIKFGQGGGDLKNIIRFIRENLETIVNVVINVTQAFIAYKAAVMAVNAAYKVKDIVTYITSLSKVKTGIEAAEGAQKGLNAAMKANVIGLVVAGIVTLIDQLDLFKSSAELAAESQERINTAFEKANTALTNLEEPYRKRIELLQKEYDLLIKKAELDGASTEDLKRLEKEKYEAVKGGSVEAYNQLIQVYFSAQDKLNKLRKFSKGRTFEETQEFQRIQAEISHQGLSFAEAIKVQEKFIESTGEKLKQARLELDEILTGQRQKTKEQDQEQAKTKEELTKKEVEAAKKARDEEYAALIRGIEREKTLEETAILRTKETEERKAELKRNAELSFLEKKLVIDKAFNKDFEKTELELVAKKVEIENAEIARKKALAEKLAEIKNLQDEAEIKNIQDKYQRERAEALHEFEQKIAQLEKDGKLTNELEIQLKKDLINKLNGIDAEQNNDHFDKDLSEWNDYYKHRELQLLKSGKTQAEIEAELKKQRIEQLKDEIALREEYGKETIDQELELARLQQDIQNETNQKRLQGIKDFSNEALSVLDREVQNNNQKRSEAIDREIQDREEQVNRQRELAAKGVTNTLAFEDAQLAKAELKKAQQARKEQRDQEKLTFLKLVQGYAIEGKASESVRRALTDIALTRVIEGSFFHGAENIADALGQPMRPGRDGYIVAVDGTERVMTGRQNEMVGPLSNDELADVARSYNMGELVPRHMAPAITLPGKPSESYASSQLLERVDALASEIRGVKESIDNRPVQQWDVVSMFELIKKEIYNNRTEKTVYKLKPRV